MKVVLLAGLAVLAVLSASLVFRGVVKGSQKTIPNSVVAQYTAWKRTFGKLYATPEEDNYRLGVFLEQKLTVDKRNSQYEEYAKENGQQLTGPMFELNSFADLSDEEFNSRYLGEQTQDAYIEENIGEVPEFTSERKTLAQTPYTYRIRNQGSCGSCWTFSAVANFEKYYFNKKNQRLDFSQQQLVDCQTTANGCSGGLPSKGLSYFAANGAALASAYPYAAADGVCKKGITTYKLAFNVGSESFGLTKAVQLVRGGIHLSVGVYASGGFRYLSKTDDIYAASSSGECAQTKNHAVNAVETDTTGSFLRILNSWGTGWGYSGTKKIKPCATNNIWGANSVMAYPY